MNSDTLIRSLVDDLQPVRRLPSVETRLARWGALALVCVAAGAVLLGLRPDLGGRLAEPGYLAENAAPLLVFVSAGRAALQLAIPGLGGSRALPALALGAWVLLVALRWSPGAVTGGPFCVTNMLALASVPAVVLAVMLRRSAPQRRALTGGLAALSASALAMAGTQLVCRNDEAGHILVWHVAPVAITALLGMATAAAARWGN